MFLRQFSCKFNFVGKVKGNDYTEWTFSFKCSKTNERYIVLLHQFEFDIFIIKFFLKKHKLSKDKYKLLTNLNNGTRILSTCIDVLIHVYTICPNASFGFIGEQLKNEKESKRFKKELINKRFSLYRRMVTSLFDDTLFSHHQYLNENAYVLLNKSNPEPDLILKIEGLFGRHYNLVSLE